MRVARILALSGVAALASCQTTTSQEGVGTHPHNAIVQSEVDRRINELRFLHGNELLQSMTRLVALGEAASDQIRSAAKGDDWLTRASLAWVMGASADRRYIPDLRGMLADSDAGVRYEAASALVELGDTAGFALLVEGLGDSDVRNRYKCFETLKRATGQDFGYQHDASPENRGAAVARWRGWLEALRASAL